MNHAPSSDQGEPGPSDAGVLEDGTLGGYQSHHSRPPAFQGMDGCPYTVSIEVEQTANLEAPFSGFLVFPRWADSGAGIVGHVETPLIFHGKSRAEVEEKLGSLPLLTVNELLQQAILRRHQETE